MPLSNIHQAYVDKNRLQRLTFCGVDDLYQTSHGAVTVERAIELDEVRRRFYSKLAEKRTSPPRVVSFAMETRNERLIDECGCGMYSD